MPDEYLDGLRPDDRIDMWRGHFSRADRSPMLVAVSTGAVVGFAVFGAEAAPEPSPSSGELYAMNLDPDYWRQGIGRLLLRRVMDALVAMGYGEAVLWVVPQNDRARALYESGGWSADGGVSTEDIMGVTVTDIRYRTVLPPASSSGVRPLDLADEAVACRVVDIQHASYRIEADLIGFDGIPPLHDTVADVRQHDLRWLGVWDDGDLAGIIAWIDVDGVREIDRLAVHPQFHRRGHARTLVEHALDHPRVVVSTGTANTPARTLYESLGFVPIGTCEIAPGVTTTGYERVVASG